MLLKIDNISKFFGSKEVLHNISFNIDKGEIHGLVGKNGAGKTTLVNIVSGILTHYDGNVIFEDQNINKLHVLERQKIGIYIVPQHAMVVPEMTIAENIFLGNYIKKNAVAIDWDKMFCQAEKELLQYGMDCNPGILAGKLSLVEKRKLNIIRALFSKSKIILLDEPTTSLTSKEREELFTFVKDLSAKGTSFVFISHYLEEILSLCKNITIIRDGYAFHGHAEKSNERTLSNMIVGEDVDLLKRTSPQLEDNKICLECRGVSARGIENVSLKVRNGEIVGVVGFPGSGAREICRAIAGINKITQGQLFLNNNKIKIPRNTREAMNDGIVYISHDRHHEGLVKIHSIKNNISLSVLDTKLKKKRFFFYEKKEVENSRKYLKKLSIKALSIDEEVEMLSGGNQQKVVVAKALSCEPEMLILDEPTIGIDVHSREEILNLVNDETEKNIGVLYLTNDYNELLRITDRLIFFYDGKLVREEKNDNLSIEKVIEIRDSFEKRSSS